MKQRHSGLILLAVAALFGLILGLDASARDGGALRKASFASCASGGQQGLKAPLDTPDVVIPNIPANSDLTFYQAWGTPGLLGPRGWHCAGLEGSSGGTLVLTPEAHQPDEFIFGKTALEGPVIEITRSFGGTSGRFTVAKTAARLFPKAAAFVQAVIDEDIQTKDDFPTGPYPADQLTYRSDFVVEYVTPPNSDGEGTLTFLGKSASPIRGVVIMDPTGDHDVMKLAVRLPKSQASQAAIIISEVENRPN